MIEKYKKLNPHLKDYSHQQYTIENPTFFQSIKTEEQFYWLGFLCADGHLRMVGNSYLIQLKLSIKDMDRIKIFAKVVGFPVERIKYRTEIREDDNGVLKNFQYAIVRFECKPMAKDLEALGFLRFKSGEIGLLDIVKAQLRRAKDTQYWGETKEGKNALSFLLGFYDGDGHYKKHRVANIVSNNKKLLDEIKNLFGSPNIPRPNKNDQTYRLTLGSNLLMAMMLSHSDSMQRKRPRGKYSERNYSKREIESFYLGNL